MKNFKYSLFTIVLFSLIFIISIPLDAYGYSNTPDKIQSPETPPVPAKPTVGRAVYHDQSKELRSLSSPKTTAHQSSISVQQSPKPIREQTFGAQSLSAQAGDGALQDFFGTGFSAGPIHSFDGVGNVNSVLPPDAQGDIGYDPATGRKYYVQWVNLSFAVWDVTETPTLVYGPVSGNTLWTGFGGPCEITNHGDPITLFDPLAQRWLMSQFSVNKPYYQCIAVSKTADPLGTWYRYAFKISDTKMNDYPHFGVWPDGYYLTVNQFIETSWAGGGVAVFEREKMLSGQAASFQFFDLYAVDPNYGGMLPADLDGIQPPPLGAPNYFVQVDDASWIGPSDALRLWEFHVDWDHPTNTTFGLNGHPNAILPVAVWTPLCIGTRGCIPQPDTSSKLDAIGDRLMHRLTYRNFGSHNSLVVNHTVDAGAGKAGVRWYEVRNPGPLAEIYQQGTYAPDSHNRWMGSAAMDGAGNIALGYSVSSRSVYPSVRYTGRLAGDPLGQMTLSEASIVEGGGSQLHSSSRWGDYSMLGVDPVDDCTFWYTQEYYALTNSASWQSRIGAFQLPNCNSNSVGIIAGTVRDASSGEGISGALVEVRQGLVVILQTYSDINGRYALNLQAGSYSLMAAAYGYNTSGVVDLFVANGESKTVDFDLDPATPVQLSGKITDALTGWPLYAKITIFGKPFDPPADERYIWSDPVTGDYSMSLYPGTSYAFDVEAVSVGYKPKTVEIGEPTQTSIDISLEVDRGPCVAIGYQRNLNGSTESFDEAALPSGWQVIDNEGSGVQWVINDPTDLDNLTGGLSSYAIVDSFLAGSKDVDSELRPPIFDFTGQTDIYIEFKYDFYYYSLGRDEIADVDIITDGGSTWTNVWQRTGSDDRGPKTALIDISELAAGKPNVQVRFHYYNANDEWWWQVDDVFVGRIGCQPLSGGLVVGEVIDGNTGLPISGATVSNDSGYSVGSVSTEDPALNGSFYSLFAPAGSSLVKAEKQWYGTVEESIQVTDGTASWLPFQLPAGYLLTEPTEVYLEIDAGEKTDTSFQLKNLGGLKAWFSISVIQGEAYTSSGKTIASSDRRTSPKHMDDPDARSVRIYEPPQDLPPLPGGEVLQVWTSRSNPWGLAYVPDGNCLWIGASGSDKGADQILILDQNGTLKEDRVDLSKITGKFMADMAYQPFSGNVWQVNVGGDNCIHEISVANRVFTGRKICPPVGVSQRGLAYDPIGDTFFSGSWSDQVIYRFDSRGNILESKDVRLNIAGLAYNPATGHLFAASNAEVGFDVYVLDVAQEYKIIGGFDLQGLEAFTQAGLDLDCEGNLWAVNQATGETIQAVSGETGVCAWNSVSGLSVSPLSGNIDPLSQQAIQIQIDPNLLPSANTTALLRIDTDMPYEPLYFPLTIKVNYLKMYFPFIIRSQ